MDNNKLITGVGLLKSAYDMCKPKSREVLQRNTMESILSVLDIAYDIFGNSKVIGNISKLSMTTAKAFLQELLAVENINEYDADNRKKIIDSINDARISISLEVGKFLTNNEFEYENRIEQVLFDIATTCINNNYYFELEGDITND